MHSYVADLTIEGFIFDKCLRNWSAEFNLQMQQNSD